MHDRFVLEGGHELNGEISVKGAKNAALKIMAAALLSEKTCTITNLPAIEDVHRMAELLESIGVIVRQTKEGTTINPKNIKNTTLDQRLVQRIRTSILIAGPLLARTGEVNMPHPGGCNIGQRPIDLFLEGFQSLGVTVKRHDGFYRLTTNKLIGGTILLSRVSVTVTEAMIMTATLADGITVIKNAAMEPEIPALVDYLNSNGAEISGAGTSTITIKGVKRLNAGTFTLIPDRLETGTFAILGLLTNSEITITDCVPEHLENVWQILRKTGAEFIIGDNTITTKKHKGLNAQNIITHEYPGFVTDLQPPYAVLMTQAKGLSLIHETIHPGRLFYTDLLNAMGANIIMCDPHRVVISGPTALESRYLASPDIRAGIALILAGLIAKGQTIIDNIYQIDRGYENIVERLSRLGAKIERVKAKGDL